MPQLDPEKLLESVAQALETMAFIAVEPLEGQAAEIDSVQVTLPFAGSIRGESRLITSRTLGEVIAANVLPDGDPEHNTLDRAHDALRELTNVITGLYLRQICDPTDVPELHVPTVSEAPATPSLEDCSASLAAEGHPLTFSIKVHE